MFGSFREINIKEGMPTVPEATKTLRNELVLARQQGLAALKVIHGYGSSGTGGAIKAGLRKLLIQRKREGRIKAVIPGEEWGLFEEASRLALERCPDLSGDSDLNQANAGITIILL